MGAPTFFSERITLVIVGLFAGRMWKKNSQNYCEMFIVYALLTNVAADLRVAGWRPLVWNGSVSFPEASTNSLNLFTIICNLFEIICWHTNSLFWFHVTFKNPFFPQRVSVYVSRVGKYREFSWQHSREAILCIMYLSESTKRAFYNSTCGRACKKQGLFLKYLINETKDFHQIHFFVNGAPFAASCWPLMLRAHSIQVYYTPGVLAWWQAPLHRDYRHFQPTRELRRALHTGITDSVDAWFDTIAASCLHVNDYIAFAIRCNERLQQALLNCVS
jgi:hypothetical protein